MKVVLAICFLFLGVRSVQAGERPTQQASTDQPAQQNQTSQAAGSDVTPAPPKLDPVKAADIQRLMDVAGMKALMAETESGMETSIRPVLLRSLPPGDYRDKLLDLFFERFRSRLSLQQFLDMAAVAYDKYLSDEDIRGLIQFYQTPLGQKALTVLPKLTVELQTEGMQMGEKAGRESMTEVLAEHPDLAKAMQDASQSSTPAQR
jgi:hypothetical protein